MKFFVRVVATVAFCLIASGSGSAVPIPPNVPVSGHLTNLQNEEQTWICPTDTHIVIANHRDFRLGYRQIGLGRSTTGGATWTDTLISLTYQVFNRQSDPIMTVTSSGRIVICHLDYMTSSATYDSSHVAFLLSDNCGQSWFGPYTVAPDIGPYFEDKQFMTSDRTGGTYDGTVYVSWTRFSDGDPTRMIFARSPSGGVFWDDTVVAGPPFETSCAGTVSAGQLSQPLVGKDGAVYLFWQGYDVDSSSVCDFYDAIRFNKSLDGGLTWQGQRMLQRVSGWSSTEGGVNIYSQPTTDADISAGPHAGNLYLQYRDTTPPLYDSDIMFRRSLDTGNSWSTPIRVNDDPLGVNSDQFHNWMVCNAQGILASIWYDQRTDPTPRNFDVFAAYSYDGGATWTSNHRVSSVSIDPDFLAAAKSGNEEFAQTAKGMMTPNSPNTPLAGLIAEYIGLTCVSDKVVAVWTDTRQGDQDVWGATWQLPLTDPRLLTPNTASLNCGDTLKWATAWKEDQDLYRLEIDNNITFVSPEFVGILTSPQLSLPNLLPGGTLHWRLKAFNAPGGVPQDSTPYSATGQFNYLGPCIPCACDCHADPGNCDNQTDVIDVVETIGVAFRGAAAIPDPNANCPFETTDVDCDTFTTVVDVVKMVNVAFRGADEAVEFCNPCP